MSWVENAAYGLIEFALVGVAPFLLGMYYEKRKRVKA
jgi:hypothetical protein